jgi:hypothetical protein
MRLVALRPACSLARRALSLRCACAQVFAILGGLMSHPVYRVKSMWSALPRAHEL